MVHSSFNPAPEPAKDENHRKGYVSREKMKFNFDDETKIITFETPAGNRVVISEEDKCIKLEDQNGNKITMDENGIRIESIKELTLKATTDLKIEGMNMTAKASASFKAEGSASAEISGASTSVKGSGIVVIQGGMVQIN